MAEPALLHTVSHTQLLHTKDCNDTAPSIQQLLHVYCRYITREKTDSLCLTETICGFG